MPRGLLYQSLRGTARIALRLYYAEVQVSGQEHVPPDAPLLLVANHPNALVDAMLVATTIDRFVCITARATLFESRLLSAFLRTIGVIPLLRAQDVSSLLVATSPRTHNVRSRALVLDALTTGKGVLLFPEGGSHDGANMIALKSGTARLALQARATGLHGLQILPIGLVYEAKDQPDSSVFVRLGRPIDVDAWCMATPTTHPGALSRNIARRLQQASLDAVPADWRTWSIRFAEARHVLESWADSVSPSRPDRSTVIPEDEVTTRSESRSDLSTNTIERIDVFIREVNALSEQSETLRHVTGAALEPGSRALSLMRDVSVVLLLFPIACVGRALRAVLLVVGRVFARYSLQNDKSRDQPAMRTILIALVLSPAFGVLLVLALLPYASVWVALLSVTVAFTSLIVYAYHRHRLAVTVRRIRAHFGSSDADPLDFHRRMRLLQETAHALEAELRSAGIAR